MEEKNDCKSASRAFLEKLAEEINSFLASSELLADEQLDSILVVSETISEELFKQGLSSWMEGEEE
jgi:preprotein translocase subunit SecF